MILKRPDRAAGACTNGYLTSSASAPRRASRSPRTRQDGWGRARSRCADR